MHPEISSFIVKTERADSATVRVPAIATIQAEMLKAQMVTFPSKDEKTSGFLALPNGASRHWAIIAVHEWWGLNDWVKEQARNLAAEGYIVLAVDLYRGTFTTKRSQARKLKRSLPEDRAIRDMKAAFNYLAARSDVDPNRIGSIGWSMGGRLALQLAIHEPRLAACVVNYGALPTDPVDIQKINAQVLGNFGARDCMVPSTEIRTFEKIMKTLNKSVDIKIYAGDGHAFANPDNKRGDRPAAAADAWLCTLTFYAQAKESCCGARVIGEAGVDKR